MTPNPGNHLVFEPVSTDNWKTYSEVGTRSYCQHYTHLWEGGNPAPYLEKSFQQEVVCREVADSNLSLFIIWYNSLPAGIMKIVRDRAVAGYSAREAMLLEKLYLLREASGQGIGRRAILYAENLGREVQKKVLWLDAMQQGPAVAFYKKNGFVVTGEKLLHFPQVLDKERPMFILTRLI